MSKLWPYWKIADEPEAGVYELVMLAGLETVNPAIKSSEKTLYICKSLKGRLNIAFAWPEITAGRIIQCNKNGDPV